MVNYKAYFVAPNYSAPSWGIGMIYHLSKISNNIGIPSLVLKIEGEPSAPNWLHLDTEVKNLFEQAPKIKPIDIVIVPELFVAHSILTKINAIKVVLVQGGFLITQGLRGANNYQEYGFREAIAVMPHIKSILTRFWPIPTSIVSPFVMDHFFCCKENLSLNNRKRQILLFPKPGYEQAGYYDYAIVISILKKKIKQINANISDHNNHWSIVELQNKSHKEVALLMKESCFLINTNCFESLNATVAEAMAAGCITFCYEAYGGQDYLIDQENAYVFKNNYVYSLLHSILDKIENYKIRSQELSLIQVNGYHTVKQYRQERTSYELSMFYKSLHDRLKRNINE